VLSIIANILYCVGVWNDRLWPDDWTAVTADGKRSAQFEHTLLVSSIPFEFLSSSLEE
jgi:methionyl aminopeptidase